MKIQFKTFTALFAILIILTASNCKQNIKAPEYIGAKNLNLDGLSLTSGAIKTDLEFNNTNNFGISVKETDLKIFVEDEYIADATQNNEIKVEANKHFMFPIIAKFNPTNILPKLLIWGNKKAFNYKITGTAKVGKAGIFIKVPINIVDVYKR